MHNFYFVVKPAAAQKKAVIVYRAPHLLRYQALEVRPVRLRARSLAPAAPCIRLPGKDIAHMGHFTTVNGYKKPIH